MPKIIKGQPGDVWQNNTGVVHWQLHTSRINVCGYCLSLEGQISEEPWPLGFHDRCRCWQEALAPGDFAQPFADYRQILADMDPAEHSKAVGKSAWLLIQAGLVTLDDVAPSPAILSLRDLVAKKRLTVDQMVKAGVARYIAQNAWDEANGKPRARGNVDLGVTRFGNGQKPRGFDDLELPVRSPARMIATGLKVLESIGWKRGDDIPDFGGSAKAIREWVTAMFPGAAQLSDADWLILIILAEEQDRLRKRLKKLGADEEKAIKAVSDVR